MGGAQYGVYGEATTGTAVHGKHNGTGNYGELGSSARGVFGFNSNGTVGIFAENDAGVHGMGGTYGVRGESNSGVGVRGKSDAGNGVNGISNRGHGLYGQSSSGYAVYGYKVGGGDYAGYFIGNVRIAGTLTATSKSFQIDHPLDPANKYPVHFCVESNELLDIYSRNVILDANGEAWVEAAELF
jgi:hypothetical protein